MAERKKSILDLFRDRVKFYAGISTEPDVWIRRFRVMKHKEVKGNYFICIEYTMRDEEKLFVYNEIETLEPPHGWTSINREWKDSETKEFLEKCTKATGVSTKKIQIKKIH